MMYPWLVLLSILNTSVSTSFKGPCPKFSSGPMTDLNNTISRGHVIFFTNVDSATNHIFYNGAHMDYMELSITRVQKEWVLRKIYNGIEGCSVGEFLTPTAENPEIYVHSVRIGNRFEGYANEFCDRSWNQYRFYRRAELAVIWGCLELEQSANHEEGLWLILLAGNDTYRQNRTQVEADMFQLLPVGNIEKGHLQRTYPKPKYRGLQVDIDCRKLFCKPALVTDYIEPLLNVAVGIAVLFFILGVYIVLFKR